MKKLIVILFLFACIFTLASCGDENDTPDGMQLVFGGGEAGYCFYAPEEWIISNVGDIKSAYISKINTTSVSFAEIKITDRDDPKVYFFGDYFEDSLAEFPTMPTMLVNGDATTFGQGDFAADAAQKYIYSYTHKEAVYKEDKTVEYKDVKFSFMQILVSKGERFFIFTYSARDNAEENGGKSNYELYLEKAQSVIDNFRFTEKTDTEDSEKEELKTDSDGFVLVSDKVLSGFELYAPKDFTSRLNAAIVSVAHGDGSSVTMTKATGTGVSAELYWAKRKAELEAVCQSVTEIEIEKEATLGNASSPLYGSWCWSYEYEYVYHGTAYRVYQILAIDGQSGYVFTYTARSEFYEAHLDDVKKMISKVRF